MINETRPNYLLECIYNNNNNNNNGVDKLILNILNKSLLWKQHKTQLKSCFAADTIIQKFQK